MHRRFGRGVARLALGTPIEIESLSSAAQAPIRGERFWAIAPGVACLALAGLVGLLASNVAMPPIPLESPTVIVADAWDVPPEPLTSAPPPAIVRTDPTPAKLREPAPEAPEAPPETAAPFDPRTLTANRAPAIPETASAPSPALAMPSRPAGLPTHRALTDLALAVPRSPRAAPSLADLTNGPRPLAESARPTAPRPARQAEGEAPAWDAMRERRAFLAGLETESHATPNPAVLERALPAVATPTSAAARAVRAAALDQLHAEGWDAVPLEDLPDCHPAGRQDALKRRILLAAADRPTCTHAEGAYRFLETRNLNAFLMGARTHDTPTRTTSGPRNACEVLERALRCLEGTPSKEIEPR